MNNRLVTYMINGQGLEEEQEVANAVIVEITGYKGESITSLTSEEMENIQSKLETVIPGYHVSFSRAKNYMSWEYFFENCLVFKSKEEKENLILQTEEYIRSIIPVDVKVSPIIDVD